jgi:antitoxin HigA-1
MMRGSFLFDLNLLSASAGVRVDELLTLDVNGAVRYHGTPMIRKHPPVHPGEVLLEEFLRPMGVSQYRLAKDIGVPARRINEIVHGQRAISADTALRLSRFFNMSERFWLNLQARYDLEVEKDRLGDRLDREVRQLPSDDVVGAAHPRAALEKTHH